MYDDRPPTVAFHPESTRNPDLTAREVQVLEAVAAGHSKREIARQMFLSEGTVKSHLARVFAKLGVRSRTAAVVRARARGVIGPVG